MFRLALFLLLTPPFAAPCLAQQFPILPGGELPIAASRLTAELLKVGGVTPIDRCP
jgi:hypothetical protein